MMVASYVASVDGINARLGSLGYSGRIGEILFGVGGMGCGVFDRVIFGGYGISFIPLKERLMVPML